MQLSVFFLQVGVCSLCVVLATLSWAGVQILAFNLFSNKLHINHLGPVLYSFILQNNSDLDE